ncbi:glycosyltransferase involved in cell wall biosynthesis [Gibbsiella quercinecans]|uniref:Glycosyltransferase 2-like domain-containing protein n=1 Tax=Gibbsiella quercinecans TaxID=929813 RepID=A0A250AXI4_9GAMM|nr:glycosyltransferase family 2 protein [Gibbsiella quercinecans]ATA18624.1 hypothetical protein AWC35_04275 [Gibbsiella quercinecans]RLM14872.1 hypothetical protein BIY30_00035 [Gibbsiella quercinecans]TCT91860.1 glycosyltransferase involved in cell wall biosynthesis [Gibbsiella quercinecans]
MNDKDALISVVIPTFNRASIILKTVNSVLAQSYKNIEVLVVDDGSLDGTEKVIANIKDSRLKFIPLVENSGGTKPRNIGIEQSRGEYIAFLDSDDEWHSRKLELQLKFFLENKIDNQNQVCMTAKINRRPEGDYVRRNKPYKGYDSIMEYILLGNDFQTSTLLCDANIAKKSLFSASLRKHQDWDFALRLEENGANFIYFDEPLTIYDDSDVGNRISKDSKLDKSLYWLETIKTRVPEHIYYGFYAKTIADTYIISSGKKINGMMIYFKFLFTGKIKYKHFNSMMSERLSKLFLIVVNKFKTNGLSKL